MAARGVRRYVAATLVLIAVATPASAQTDTDATMAKYRAFVSGGLRPCAKATDPDEILVCARSKLRESQKVPYIEETRRGDRPVRAPGEPFAGPGGPPCGPRGEGCYEGPGISGTLKALIARIKGD